MNRLAHVCFCVTGISAMVLLKLWEESTGRLEFIKPWLQNEASAGITYSVVQVLWRSTEIIT